MLELPAGIINNYLSKSKEYMELPEIIRELESGIDSGAREQLCVDLEHTIRQSNEGTIGLADFIRDLETALVDARFFASKFNNQ